MNVFMVAQDNFFLYADDTVLLVESEGMLQGIVDELHRVCKRRKLKANVGKSKVMVLKEQESRLLILQSHIEWGQTLYLDIKCVWGGRR